MFPLKCLFLEQSHPWSSLSGASGVDRENLGYFRMQIPAVLRNLLMCTSSSDIINSENMLFPLEAVYITLQQCLNPDVFIWKGCSVKKQRDITFDSRDGKSTHLCATGLGPKPSSVLSLCPEPQLALNPDFREGLSFLVVF